MAAVLQPYSTDAFNTLPDLHTAQESFVSKNGMDLVDNLYKPMIEKYQLEAKLGVGLLHRHFDLEGSEKLVEFNNISLPWQNHNGDDYSGGKIVPNAWAVSGNKLLPYEFYYSPLGRDSPFDFDATSKFLSEFMQATSELGLEHTLCLRLFPHVGFTGALELTEGRANINLSPDQVTEHDWDNTTETMWFFEPEYMRQKRVCRCSGPTVHMHFHSF
jgi:hypothetical protein